MCFLNFTLSIICVDYINVHVQALQEHGVPGLQHNAADLVLEGEAFEQAGLCVVEPDAVGARARAAQPAAAHSQQPAIVRPINRHVCTM